MFVRNVPRISFIADPRVLGSIQATSIVTRGVGERMKTKIGDCPFFVSVAVWQLQQRSSFNRKTFCDVLMHKPFFTALEVESDQIQDHKWSCKEN